MFRIAENLPEIDKNIKILFFNYNDFKFQTMQLKVNLLPQVMKETSKVLSFWTIEGGYYRP